MVSLTKGKYKDFIGMKKDKYKFKENLLPIFVLISVGMTGLYTAGFICYGSFPYMDTTMIQPLPVWAAAVCVLLIPLSTTLAEDGIYLGAINDEVILVSKCTKKPLF